MAQFDVFRNSGKHRDIIPFVVAVQSVLYDDYGRRVVVPLVRAAALGTLASPRLDPTLKIRNILLVLHALEIVPGASARWASLSHRSKLKRSE